MPLEKPKEPPNFYDLLNLRADATDPEIELGYKSASFRYHPDRYHTPEDKEAANEWMKYVNVARDTLKDPVKRAAYDRTRGSRKPPPPPPPPPAKPPAIRVDKKTISVEAVQGQPIRASFVVRQASGSGKLPPKWSLVVEKDGILSKATVTKDPPHGLPATVTVTLPPQPAGVFEGSIEVYVKEEV